MTNHQRVGAVSNAHAGREFEVDALDYFSRVEGIEMTPSISLPLGVGKKTKLHRFDLGAVEPAVLVECKSHNWTATGNMPSAKVTVWNEAMYYFHLAPKHYRKVMFVLESRHAKQTDSLAEYYVRINSHLIPDEVEIIEYNPVTKAGRYVSRRAATVE